MRSILSAVVAAMLATCRPLLAAAGGSMGSGAVEALPLGEFLDRIRSAEYAAFATLPHVKVADEAAFTEMKTYLLDRYEGVDPGQIRGVFVDGNGSVFDCIPTGQQPALQGSRPATQPPPDLPRPRAKAGEPKGRSEAAFGDAACPPDTIPLQRISLETLVGFASLGEFYRK